MDEIMRMTINKLGITFDHSTPEFLIKRKNTLHATEECTSIFGSQQVFCPFLRKTE
jgi:hypothetical protein